MFFKNNEKKTEIRFLFFVIFFSGGKEAAWLVLQGNPSCVLSLKTKRKRQRSGFLSSFFFFSGGKEAAWLVLRGNPS